MDDAEAIYAGLTSILFQHDARCVAPAWNGDAASNGDVHELHEALKQCWILNEGLVVAEMPTRG